MNDLFTVADATGQEKVLRILNNIFSGCTLNIEQHTEDKGRVDIFMTATTHNGIRKTYAIECKDRWFPHSQYPDMMLDKEKYDVLKSYSKSGYTPIFFNTFSDDTYMVWDVLKATVDIRNHKTKKTTVEYNGYVDKPRCFFKTSDFTFSGTTS